jgi:hypothetical protein
MSQLESSTQAVAFLRLKPGVAVSAGDRDRRGDAGMQALLPRRFEDLADLVMRDDGPTREFLSAVVPSMPISRPGRRLLFTYFRG